MEPERDTYYEGESIHFTLTIINTDSAKTWPVLLPTPQATGKKLFHFEVWEPTPGEWRHVALEPRNCEGGKEPLGRPAIYKLEPGDSVSFEAVWNPADEEEEGPVRHHLGFPLVEGQYIFGGYYNASGHNIPPTLYQFYGFSIPFLGRDMERLWFSFFGESVKCEQPITILPARQKKIQIEGKRYKIKQKRQIRTLKAKGSKVTCNSFGCDKQVERHFLDGKMIRQTQWRYKTCELQDDWILHPVTGKLVSQISWWPNGKVSTRNNGNEVIYQYRETGSLEQETFFDRERKKVLQKYYDEQGKFLREEEQELMEGVLLEGGTEWP